MTSEAKIIIGVDEAGRGALAGPLVVCAVAFRREDSPPTASYVQLNKAEKLLVTGDSKGIKEGHREVLDPVIRETAHAYALIERSNKEIDARLLYHVFPEALQLAIARCIESVVARGEFTNPRDFVVLVDGETPLPPNLPCPAHAIPDGDKLMWQIGAASILAKVACDAKMMALDKLHPEYRFAKNKGYPTKDHRALLKEHGPSPVHRLTFRPVAEAKGHVPGFEEF